MKGNLRTVFFDSNGKLKTIHGWNANFGNNSLSLPILGQCPIKGVDFSKPNRLSPCFVKSGSLKTIEVESRVPVYSEELECYTGEYRTVKGMRWAFNPIPDDNFYYLFILRENEPMSFSPDIKFMVSDRLESYQHSEKYDFFAYVSFPNDVPFILDTHNNICVSPFYH